MQNKKRKRKPTTRKKTSAKKKTTKKPTKTTRRRKKRRTKAQKAEARERRRLREEAAPGRGVTAEDRKRVFDFYGRVCLMCGKKKRKMCLDHVIALYMGGRHDPDNLQPLCWPCNKRKGLKTIDYRPKPYPY